MAVTARYVEFGNPQPIKKLMASLKSSCNIPHTSIATRLLNDKAEILKDYFRINAMRKYGFARKPPY